MRRAAALPAWLLIAGCTESGQVLGPAGGASGAPPVTVSHAARRVAAGETHTCALLLDGSVQCWGSNQRGQLGNGAEQDALRPSPVVFGEPFDELCAGNDYTCAVTERGAVACWGGNQRGQLGQGDRDARSTPVAVELPAAATRLACGFEHVCALLANGELSCWGKNGEGELARGDEYPGDDRVTTVDALRPVRAGTGTFRGVGAGDGHTCAVRADGTLWCSGRNTQGQLGPASHEAQVRNLVQLGTDTDWAEVSAGQLHGCGQRSDGSVWCWGTNAIEAGQGFVLGVPGRLVRTPTRLPLPPVQRLATHTFHGCALASGGELWCWGRNFEGQLGSDDPTLRSGPESLGRSAIDVAVNVFSTCFVDPRGAVLCTGENGEGQLGSGDRERSSAFVEVPLAAN